MNLGQLTDKQRGTYAQVPIELIMNPCISDGAVRLYAYMQWREGTGQNFEGRESMAEALGISEKTVSNRAGELEVWDWVAVSRRNNKKGRTTNYYRTFETQQACRRWRDQNSRPKTERPLQPRKGREGIGGAPTHKPPADKENSSSPTYQPSDENSGSLTAGENGNSSSPTDGNSSSPTFGENGNSSSRHYPDSESIHLQIYPSSNIPTPSMGDSGSPQGAASGETSQAPEMILEPEQKPPMKSAEPEKKSSAKPKKAKRRVHPDSPPVPAERMNPMKDALVAAFGWDPQDMGNDIWNVISTAARQLCLLTNGPRPEQIVLLYEYLVKIRRMENFGPVALSKWWPAYQTWLRQGGKLPSDRPAASASRETPRDLTVVHPENPLTHEQEARLIANFETRGRKS